MYRLRSSTPVPGSATARRPAESDATVMTLSGLVLILVFLLAVVSGVAVWKWRQAEELRHVADQRALQAEVRAMKNEVQPDGGRLNPADNPLEDRAIHQATLLVGVNAEGPLPLLPLLYPEPELAPEGGPVR